MKRLILTYEKSFKKLVVVCMIVLIIFFFYKCFFEKFIHIGFLS